MPTEDVLNTVKWKPLRHIYFQRLLVLAYKCYYELMPGPLKGLLAKHETRYCLRKQLCVNIPIPKTDMVKKSIQYCHERCTLEQAWQLNEYEQFVGQF